MAQPEPTTTASRSNQSSSPVPPILDLSDDDLFQSIGPADLPGVDEILEGHGMEKDEGDRQVEESDRQVEESGTEDEGKKSGASEGDDNEIDQKAEIEVESEDEPKDLEGEEEEVEEGQTGDIIEDELVDGKNKTECEEGSNANSDAGDEEREQKDKSDLQNCDVPLEGQTKPDEIVVSSSDDEFFEADVGR